MGASSLPKPYSPKARPWRQKNRERTVTFSKLLFTAGVLGLAVFVQPSLADTTKDTLVVATQIDDIITLDPAEVFEFSGGEVIANVYDRIFTYEAEDTA